MYVFKCLWKEYAIISYNLLPFLLSSLEHCESICTSSERLLSYLLFIFTGVKEREIGIAEKAERGLVFFNERGGKGTECTDRYSNI